MSNRLQLSAVVLLVALGAAACSSGGASPSAAPSSGAVSSPSGAPDAPTVAPSPSAQDGIAHPTGANEVVLRFDEAGGFVPPEWLAARLPYFTLYGDGRVVFVQSSVEIPARADNIAVGYPLRTVVLSEAQVQDLLEFALKDGGLAIAKTDYQNPMVADAPTAVFTINAADDSKTVSAVALGMDAQPGPDTIVLKQLATLAERLRDFDRGGTFTSAAYEATAYRGVILEQQGLQGVQVREWPWDAIAPADFKLPADANMLPQGTRTLTPDEARAVGVEGFENGVSNGIYLKSSDGKLYSLVIRPLLPDEQS
jgi:hypothetical protein